MLCLTKASLLDTDCFKMKLITIDDTIIITQPTIQQLSDNIILSMKFFFKSFIPFLISFLNNKISNTMYIKSFIKKQNILGVLGILLKLTPNELTNDKIKFPWYKIYNKIVRRNL